jgi:hypothetical protein
MRNGFTLVIVISFLAVVVLVTWLIINIGCGEILQTRKSNDLAMAYYVATAGAEMMYANLKSKEGTVVSWPQTVPTADSTLTVGGVNIGSFTATATPVSQSVLAITSEGTVNGQKARAVVRYGFGPESTPYPLGSTGPMDLNGTSWWIFRSWVNADGPLESASNVTKNNLVNVATNILENQPIAAPSFWLGATYDTNNDGQFVGDTNGDGVVTIADAGGVPAQIAAFAADDTNGDGVVDSKDAFIYYYTVHLNNQLNLGIGPGQSHYYSGTQTFTPWSVPAGTPIIFVNGDVNILFNDQSWWGASQDHAIISTGTITIVQPTNGSNDRLSLIAYSDVVTGGVGLFGGIQGDIVIYAGNGFFAYYGGHTDGTIFTGGQMYIDTVLPIPGLLNRDLHRSSIDWTDTANLPLGVPPGYPSLSMAFVIKAEDVAPPTGYPPQWQRE